MFRPDLAWFYRVNLFFFLDLLKVLGRDIIKFCFIRFSWGQQSFPRTGSTGTRSSGMFFKLINNMINILTDRDDVQGFTVRPRRRLDQDEKNQHHGRHLGARCCCCCCCSSNEKIQWNSTLLPWNSFWNTTRHRKGCPDWLIAYRWNESLFFVVLAFLARRFQFRSIQWERTWEFVPFRGFFHGRIGDIFQLLSLVSIQLYNQSELVDDSYRYLQWNCLWNGGSNIKLLSIKSDQIPIE